MLWPSKIQFAICEFCVQHNGIYFQSMVRYMRLTDTVYTTHHLPIQVYYLHIFKCYRIVRVLIKKELIVILLLFFFFSVAFDIRIGYVKCVYMYDIYESHWKIESNE